MCGIVGIYSAREDLAECYGSRVESALEAIAHRGPDHQGVYVDDKAILGHARISIIDLTNAGNQPMATHDKHHVVTYNGEIYNFSDLKRDLDVTGYEFQSTSDTEVLLMCFREYGVKAFERFNGMFAFSLLDKINRKAYLVRDRFGIKPLYYKHNEEGVFFASEIKAIKEIVSWEGVNEEALPEWSFYGNSLEDRTLHRNIHQLLPGHFLEIDLETLSCKLESYWTVESVFSKNKISNNSIEPVIQRTKKLMEEAVCSQLVGDVPIGVFLSGGLDSSAITAIAASNYSGSINTFSVGFDFELGEGELPKARKVAELFNTNHHEMRVSGYDIADIVKKMVVHHDSPFSDAANIPLYLLAQAVQEQVKVVLQGDGGDEIFAGYKRYNTLSARSLWQPFIKVGASIHKGLFPRNKKYHSRQRYLNALSSDDEADLMALLLTVEDREWSPLNIFSKDMYHKLEQIDPFESYRRCNKRFSHMEIVQRMLFTDTQLILPSIFLEKVDRAAMAASIEVRVPFLDNALAEYVMSLPSEVKVRRGEKKWLLKKAMASLLPKSVLYAPKTGFGVPYQLWLKGPLRDLFHDSMSQLKRKKCNVLNWPHIEALMKDNAMGCRDNSFMLWKILNLMIWLYEND